MRKDFIKRISACVAAVMMAAVMSVSAAVPALADVTEVSGPVGAGPAFKSYFQGEELKMLSNQTDSQMNSFVLTSKDGQVVVIDGGTPGDAMHLRNVLESKGNHVSAWFITHPHRDHGGALAQIIEDGLGELKIDAVYYNFLDQETCNTYEPGRADMVQRITNALATLGDKAHVMHKGDVVTVDSITITTLNDPYLIATNTINNSSCALKVNMGGKTIMFLGDLGAQVNDRWLADHADEDLKCDIVQMAHHGQDGVNQDFYAKLKPVTCLWCAPAWLYDDTEYKYRTSITRGWMKDLGVSDNYCIKDGDQTLK